MNIACMLHILHKDVLVLIVPVGMHALQPVGCVDLCIILMTEAVHDFRLNSSVLLNVYT